MTFRPRSSVIAALLLACPALAQQFQVQPNLPGGAIWTEGVECADVDQDGDLDIFFAKGNGFSSPGTQQQNVLVINKLVETGPGVFADESVARLGTNLSHGKGVATGDVDGDGWVDALFANAFFTDPPGLYVNQGSGNPGFFSHESAARGFTVSYSSGGAQFGDLDDDGDLDVIIADAYLGAASGKPHLFFNNGAGVFTENAAALGAPNKSTQMDVQLVDFDNDWDLDFFGSTRAVNAGGNHYLMTNNGSGTFTDASGLLAVGTGNTYEADCGDLDGDSDIDLFFVSFTGFQEGSVRNNMVPNGSLSFTNQSAIGGAVDDNEIALCDWDNDADYDVMVGSLGSHEYMYRNNGAFSFTDVSAATISFVSEATLDCTFGDLDNDGDYDAITAQGESTPYSTKWYRNTTGTADTLAPVVVAVNGPAFAAAGPFHVRAKVRDQVLDDNVSYVSSSARYVVNASPLTSAVSIDPSGFSTGTLNIAAGTTVTWTNNSGASQDVTSTTTPYTYASGTIAPLGTYAHTFVAPGTYGITSTLSAFTMSVVVSGSATTVAGLHAGGQIHRFDFDGTGGAQVCWELEFADWPGNVRITDGACTTMLTCTGTNYCTAKVNSIGCTPAISMTGSADASAGSGCTLSTVNVIGNKFGVYFHSLVGAQAAPFHGGFLCVKAPIKRHPVISSGGTGGVCNGLFSEDFNTYIAGGADPALVAGVQVWIQNWSRDPGDAFTDSLSDAVTVQVCP